MAQLLSLSPVRVDLYVSAIIDPASKNNTLRESLVSNLYIHQCSVQYVKKYTMNLVSKSHIYISIDETCQLPWDQHTRSCYNFVTLVIITLNNN